MDSVERARDGAVLIDGLRRLLNGREAAPVAVVETHLSWVLLSRDHALKVKKPLKLPFVDFTTLAERRRCCEEEIRLNRRLAPSLYLDVAAIRGTPAAPTFEGNGPVIEYAVRMKRFPADALLSDRLAAGCLGPQTVDRLAAKIAAFHEDAAIAPVTSDFGTVQRNTEAALNALAVIEASAGTAPCALLRGWIESEAKRLGPLWNERRIAARVRECHGDLHLANTIVLGDEVTAFDGIEFDPALRWIDVLADIAFLVMDLAAHGRRDLAARALNAYLDAGGDHAGVPTLRFFVVYRALVRAEVGLLREAQGGQPTRPSAREYIELAREWAGPGSARLLITHGLPGSGKSFLSQLVLEQCNAIRLRSDIERKRLFGLAALDDSRARQLDLYGSDATRRTYDRLLLLARVALGAGWPTIVDAAFLHGDERDRFAALAREVGVPFAILDCRAPTSLLRERVIARATRRDDPSEADLDVLDRLTAASQPLTGAELAHAIVADVERPSDPVAISATWMRLR